MNKSTKYYCIAVVIQMSIMIASLLAAFEYNPLFFVGVPFSFVIGASYLAKALGVSK